MPAKKERVLVMSIRTVVTGILTAATVIGVVAAFFMALTGDPYLGLFGYMIGSGSGLVGAAALALRTWGRPMKEAVAMIVGGAAVGAVVIFGSMHAAFSIADSRREANNAKQQEEYAKAYREAKAYRFEGVRYEPLKNKLVARASEKNGLASRSVFVVPVGNEFVLIIDGPDAYAFDSGTSTRVNFDGVDPEGENIAAGKFAFRGKNYSIEAMNHVDMEYGRDAGGEAPYVNPKLVDAIAPMPKIRAGKLP
jgi:hypothetical protein